MTTSCANHKNTPFTCNNAEKNTFANSVHKDLSIFVQDAGKYFLNDLFCKMKSVIKFFLFQMSSDINLQHHVAKKLITISISEKKL